MKITRKTNLIAKTLCVCKVYNMVIKYMLRALLISPFHLLCFSLFIISCSPKEKKTDFLTALFLVNYLKEEQDGVSQMVSVNIDNNKVLVCGGTGNGLNVDRACFIFHDTLTRVVDMLTIRNANHSMIQLNNGNVFIVGGNQGQLAISNTEIFDRSTNSFVLGPNLNYARSRHTLTKLNDGKVLIVGGSDSNYSWLRTVELYDPVTNTLEIVGDLNVARGRHRAELLSSGEVLIIGGEIGKRNTNTTEIYDPVAKTFRLGGTMNSERGYHTSSVFTSDKVFVFGGSDILTTQEGVYLDSIEVYNHMTETFSSAGRFPEPRANQIQVKLSDNDVLICGGANGNVVPRKYFSECYKYNANTLSLVKSGSMLEERVYASMNLLSSGKVLICGGNSLSKRSNTCELMDHTSGESKIIVEDIF